MCKWTIFHTIMCKVEGWSLPPSQHITITTMVVYVFCNAYRSQSCTRPRSLAGPIPGRADTVSFGPLKMRCWASSGHSVEAGTLLQPLDGGSDNETMEWGGKTYLPHEIFCPTSGMKGGGCLGRNSTAQLAHNGRACCEKGCKSSWLIPCSM